MRIIYCIIVLINFLYSFNFNHISDIPQVILNDIEIQNGFLGGTNSSVVRWIDWDQDNDSDLFLLDEDGHIRYYQNISSDSEYKFITIDTNFLGISNITWFYIGDFDNDNDFDIVTQYDQNPSYISYYTNENGNFSDLDLIQNQNGSYVLSQQGAVPTFCDIDNDNDLDFFSVNLIGTVSFYENVGLNNNKPIYNFITSDWEEISIVGQGRHGANAINFIDMDNDNDFDLVWGDYYQSSLYVIWNIGNIDIPDMDHINFSTYFPEDDPIYTVGRNMPSFTDIDFDGDQDLFVTVLGGTGGVQLVNNFYFYRNNGLNSEPNYTFITDNFLNTIDHISDTCPELIDIDFDGDLDLFIGQKFTTDTTPYTGRILFYLNTGTSENPTFDLTDSEFLGNDIGTNLCPKFGDIDSDGDYDLLIGTYSGNIHIYKNIGNKYSFNFIYHSLIETDSDFWFSVPSLYDVDLDLDLDIILGNIYGNLVLYRQENPFSFVFDTDNFSNINVGYYSSPYFFDIDLDNDKDLLVGGRGIHKLYLNNNEIFVESSAIQIPYLGKDVKFTGGNLFYSNQFNIISGISTGGLYILTEDLCAYGDLNQDEIINISDLIMLISIILDDDSIQSYFYCSGDLNNDTGINILDISLYIQLLLN